MGGKRKKRRKSEAAETALPPAKPSSFRWGFLALAFVLGVFTAVLVLPTIDQNRGSPAPAPTKIADSLHIEADQRSVAQLAALSDDELEKVDIVEMSIAVAREIDGLEKLDYDKYRNIVDGWTGQFRRWLPSVEYAFHEAPSKYKNDINFFRLGMLAQFLDQQVGIAYNEDQKQETIVDKKKGVKSQILYTNPGDVLLHGLIDTKRGTCGTMPTLHVAIGRRLGWPVGLACVDSHYLCRYDDGKVVYNFESTDTGRGGFAAETDREYLAKKNVSKRAIAVGSDLRKLSAREMIGVFVQLRARHHTDVGKIDRATVDYALAHTLFPRSRHIYIGLIGNLLPTGDKLFTPGEHGHPYSLAAHLSRTYDQRPIGLRSNGVGYSHRALLAEAERIEAINRANRERMMMPSNPQQHQTHMPGHRNPAQPY